MLDQRWRQEENQKGFTFKSAVWAERGFNYRREIKHRNSLKKNQDKHQSFSKRFKSCNLEEKRLDEFLAYDWELKPQWKKTTMRLIS